MATATLVGGQRLSDQTIETEDGVILTGKNVRIITEGTFIDLGGDTAPGYAKAFGEARIGGMEVPVLRKKGLRGRQAGKWFVAGEGQSYRATFSGF